MKGTANLTTSVRQIIKGEVSCIDDSFIIIDRLDKLNISTHSRPIRLDAATVGVCFSGEMLIDINGVEHQITPGKLIITLSNDIIQYRRISDDIKGMLLIVSQSFLEGVLNKVYETLPLFLYIQKYPCVNLSIKELDMMKSYYDFFEMQLNYKHPYPFQNRIIGSILQAFICYITSICINEKDLNKHSRNEEIFRQFLQLTINNFQKREKLNFYAQKLCVSTKYLCEIIKRTSGHTPREWIDHYTILEAKILLQTTDMTTEQISYELNFPNTSFFCKFFRKNVGMTTKEYRMSLFQ